MIKNIDSKHIDKLVTPSVLPTLEPLLKKHVDAGAILVKVVDETIFSTEESTAELYESLSYMQLLGAAWNQCLLVVRLMGRGSARPYDQLTYWFASGGIAVAVDNDEESSLLKSFDKLIEGKYA